MPRGGEPSTSTSIVPSRDGPCQSARRKHTPSIAQLDAAGGTFRAELDAYNDVFGKVSQQVAVHWDNIPPPGDAARRADAWEQELTRVQKDMGVEELPLIC